MKLKKKKKVVIKPLKKYGHGSKKLLVKKPKKKVGKMGRKTERKVEKKTATPTPPPIPVETKVAETPDPAVAPTAATPPTPPEAPRSDKKAFKNGDRVLAGKDALPGVIICEHPVLGISVRHDNKDITEAFYKIEELELEDAK